MCALVLIQSIKRARLPRARKHKQKLRSVPEMFLLSAQGAFQFHSIHFPLSIEGYSKRLQKDVGLLFMWLAKSRTVSFR